MCFDLAVCNKVTTFPFVDDTHKPKCICFELQLYSLYDPVIMVLLVKATDSMHKFVYIESVV